MAYYNGTGTGLEALLYGEVAWAGVDEAYDMEIVKYSPRKEFSDYELLIQGPNRPRPMLTAYDGYDGPQCELTYWLNGSDWVNCKTGDYWK